MTSITHRLIPTAILSLFITLSMTAQINSGVGYMHGTDKKGDTIIDYHDNPKNHVHEEVKVIRETKLTPAEAAKYEGKASKAATAQRDTTATAAATVPERTDTLHDTTTTAGVTDVVIGNIAVTGCDCINMNMIYTAIAVFGLAAIIGMYLIMLLMRDRKRPPFVIFIHGMFATAGLTLFCVYCFYQPGPLASLTILLIAALCGLVLIYNDITGRPVPKWLGILHGALALVGFVLLLVFAFAH
jgi:hypothetical protein